MIKMFKQMSKKEVTFFISSVLFMILQVWLELEIPGYMSEITTLVTTGGETSEIIHIGIIMILCALGGFIVSVIISFFSSFVGTSFEKNLRSRIFRKVQDFGMEEIKKFSTSSLITRDTNDVTQVKNFVVMGSQMLARAPIMASMAIFKILGKEWQFSAITFIGVFVILAMISIIIVFVIPKFKKVQELTDNLNRVTRENLTGIKVVRAFNAENYQKQKFDKANNELTKTHWFIGRMMSLMDPVMTLIMSSIPLAIYWVGASLINSLDLTGKIALFSDMVVFSSYSIQVIMSFMFLIMIFVIYPRASVSMGRISEIIDTEEKIKDGKLSGMSNVKGTVEFKNVSFKYPDADECVLENINLKINKGQTIAFIGGTGSGKSTLVNLIPRFYDVTEGEILVDDINVKDMPLTILHNKIGYVSQKAVLFKGTISTNIKLGKNKSNEISDDNIWDAINISQAEEFVSKMDKKIHADIAQNGTNVSGGQKQRLSIARALARNPEIFIFDDAFSALDFKTDYLLRKELNNKYHDTTKIIVASRIGTIIDADMIVVLENGKCVGMGKHKELLKNCNVYKEIALSQLSKEELEDE